MMEFLSFLLFHSIILYTVYANCIVIYKAFFIVDDQVWTTPVFTELLQEKKENLVFVVGLHLLF